jgi:hypothetical protein
MLQDLVLGIRLSHGERYFSECHVRIQGNLSVLGFRLEGLVLGIRLGEYFS